MLATIGLIGTIIGLYSFFGCDLDDCWHFIYYCTMILLLEKPPALF